LGYEQPVGEHLKFLASAQGRPIACLAWSSAPRHLGSRDRYIGWNREARRCDIRFIAYNTRFLILPWVAVPHLASHLLSRMAQQLSRDWERMYGHPLYFLETFVDPERFRGTKSVAAGHGRHPAAAYRGARKVKVRHATLQAGDPCPDSQCDGKVYPQRDPGVLVRLQGQAPIAATVYELEKLRCNLCGNVYTAEAPPAWERRSTTKRRPA
jgi:hypothetical protein